jgi:hypothetical protein
MTIKGNTIFGKSTASKSGRMGRSSGRASGGDGSDVVFSVKGSSRIRTPSAAAARIMAAAPRVGAGG